MAHTKYFNSEGKEVPSTTTVLQILNKPSLIGWANNLGFRHQTVDSVLEKSSYVGSQVHFKIENELRQSYGIYTKLREDCKDRINNIFNTYLEWKKIHLVDPIFVEKSFTSKTFGGTMDLYGDIDNKKTVVDFKTSKTVYVSNFIQLSGYTLLLEENGYKVDQALVLQLGEKKYTEKIIQRKELEEYVEIFKMLCFAFHKYRYVLDRDKWGESI